MIGPVHAGTCTSAATGNWNTAATWTGCGGTGLPGNNDNVVIAATHTVTLNVNSASITNVTINAGGFLQGDNTGRVLTVGSGTGGTVTVTGTLNFGAGSLATVLLNRNNQWTGGGNWDLSVLNLGTRTLSFTAGTTATLNFSGAAAPISVTTGAVTSLSTITWNFTGTVAQTLPTSTNVIYGAVRTNNSTGVTLGVALSATSLLDNLSIQTGIFNDGGYAIVGNTGKTFSVSNGATFNLTNATGMVTGFSTKTFGATSTVDYALNGNQPVSAETYGHLTLSSGGTKTPDTGTTTIAGDFTLATGVTYAGTTNNPTVNLAGDFSNSGTFNSGTGTFTFNGSAASQSLTGATTFSNMALNNGNDLTLNNNATVNTLLTFTSGRITTGANKVIIGSAGSITGQDNTRYAVGTMEKAYPGAGSFTFAIGDATNYTPATANFTAMTATGSLAVNTTAGDHPNIGTSGIDPSQSVNRYWTLTDSGGLAGTYDATFVFVASDKDGGSDFSIYEVRRYAGGWNVTIIGTRNSLDTQATGLTAYGDFAIGELLPTVDHYLVSHDGGGVTCLTENITFTAHNAGHVATAVDLGNDLSISTSTGKGTWVSVVFGSGSGTLADATAGDGAANYEFPGGETAVTLEFRYTNPAADPEAVNFNVSDNNSKTETTGTAAGDSDDADLIFSKTGFVFYNSSDAITTIPTQIAGKRSDQGFGAKNLALRAVKVSDSDPSVCSTLFANATTVNVDLGAECKDPGTCAGQQVSVTNNGNTTAIATSNDSPAPSYTPNISLLFAANSTAELHLSYPDAGQMQLHARYDLGDPVGTYMTGSSNDFVVRPFGFHVTATGNPAAANESGTVYKAADEDFTVSVSSVGWQSGDDGNDDGVPDGHESADSDPTNNADLSDNPVLPNYGQESGSGEDGTLSAALYLPAGGADPGLSGGISITSFTAGVGSSSTARYAEVGIIEIGAAVGDGDYLGIGAAATALARGKSGRVGRFRPYEFTLTGNTPAFAAGCNADTTDFTYMDQPFDYATAPQVTITAVSKLGTTTTNYDGAWWKLANFTTTYAHDGDPLPGGVALDDATAGHTAVDCSGGACNGAFTSTFSGPFTYTRTVTSAAPFDAAVDITLSNITDSDGVTYAGNPFKFNDVVFSGGANQQRWGRLVIGEAVGDPALVLDVPINAEYYDGAAFVQNADDDCAAFTLADDVVLSNEASGTQAGDQAMTIGTGSTSVTSGDGQLVNGADLMTFSAPGAGNTGLVDITLDLDTVTGADLPWLYFDWDGEGLFETTTSGRASFGIISRPESVIYSREPW